MEVESMRAQGHFGKRDGHRELQDCSTHATARERTLQERLAMGMVKSAIDFDW